VSQVLILCEGYDDRAFWKCWLASLGAVDLFTEAGSDRTRLEVYLRDSGVAASDGDYCMRSGSNDFFVVRPCKSQKQLWKTARIALKNEQVTSLVINCDSDLPDTDPEPMQRRLQQFEQLRSESLGTSIALDLVVWHCDDPPGLPGIPSQQTLERLICAAVAAAMPKEWAAAVEDFLHREPVFGPTHKNFLQAYRAKFFAHDFDDINQAVWSRVRFPEIAQQLEERLRRNGDWERVAALFAGR
jgi:hypothetical protein